MNATKTATRVNRHQRRKAIKILRQLDAALPENEDFYYRAATVAGRIMVLTGRDLGRVAFDVARALEDPERCERLLAQSWIPLPVGHSATPADTLAALELLEEGTAGTAGTFLAARARLTLTTDALYAAVLDVYKRSSRK